MLQSNVRQPIDQMIRSNVVPPIIRTDRLTVRGFLHKVFDTNEANQLTVPEMIPAWFALRKVFEFLIHLFISILIHFSGLILYSSDAVWAGKFQFLIHLRIDESKNVFFSNTKVDQKLWSEILILKTIK